MATIMSRRQEHWGSSCGRHKVRLMQASGKRTACFRHSDTGRHTDTNTDRHGQARRPFCPAGNTSSNLPGEVEERELCPRIPMRAWRPRVSLGVARAMLWSAERGRLLVRLGLLERGLGLLVPGGLLVARALAKRGGMVVLALAIEVEVSIILYT